MRLRCLLSGPSADGDATVEVLEYFMRRLSSGMTKERDAAIKVSLNTLPISAINI